jgi:hypothetical protein
VFCSPFCEEIRPKSFREGDRVIVFEKGNEIQAEIARVKESKDGLPDSTAYFLLPQNTAHADYFLDKTVQETNWDYSVERLRSRMELLV